MNNKNLLPIILLVIVVIVGILGFKFIFTSPQNGGLAAPQNEQVSLSTNPSPPRLGKTTFVISVKDQNGRPVDNAKVSFDLNMTTMNMGTQQGDATAQGNGQYAANGTLSMGGPWAIRTKVTMPEGDVISKDFTINVY